MSKYLVIGSNGTLGSEFLSLLPKPETLAVDRDELDITDPVHLQNFFASQQPQVVINCAAYTNVDGAETDYETAKLLNADVLVELSKQCNQVGAKLIHFSTGMIFAGTDQNGYNEDSPPAPVNNYGASKLAGEQVIQQTCTDYYIIRTEWLYGKPLTETAKKSFVELMIDLGKSGKVKGVIDEVGKPTWARDLAKAVLDLTNSGQSKGIYHLVNEGQASRLDWSQEIFAIKGMTVELESVSGSDFPRPAKRPQFELLNNNKLPKLRAWQDALREYLTN
jgi:dTDP-4-dehydrorhamnose reductase